MVGNYLQGVEICFAGAEIVIWGWQIRLGWCPITFFTNPNAYIMHETAQSFFAYAVGARKRALLDVQEAQRQQTIS